MLNQDIKHINACLDELSQVNVERLEPLVNAVVDTNNVSVTLVQLIFFKGMLVPLFVGLFQVYLYRNKMNDM